MKNQLDNNCNFSEIYFFFKQWFGPVYGTKNMFLPRNCNQYPYGLSLKATF